MAWLGLLLSIGVDADHVGGMLGLPTLSRGSHTAPFFAMACLLFWLLGSRKILRAASPLVLALLVGVSYLQHIGIDALVNEGDLPIYAPFSWRFVRFDQTQRAILAGGAVGLALWGRLGSRWEERTSAEPGT